MTDCIFPKMLESPEMCAHSATVTEAAHSGLKFLPGLIVKCSSLVVARRQLCLKSVALWVFVVLLAPLGFAELVV